MIDRTVKKAGPGCFEKIEGLAGILVARTKKLQTFAITLRSGGVALFSPAAGPSIGAEQSLGSFGRVTALVAPNHYHNLGLGEYAGRFPDARLYASADAIPRLEKQTRLDFHPVTDLADELPAGARILFPPGLKTGEIWIRFKGKNERALMVGDAFCGPGEAAPNGAPSLLKTFPRYGVGDPVAYREWALVQFEKENPTILAPCHGAVVRHPQLAAHLAKLVRDGF